MTVSLLVINLSFSDIVISEISPEIINSGFPPDINFEECMRFQSGEKILLLGRIKKI
jgi:hypothetical protein